MLTIHRNPYFSSYCTFLFAILCIYIWTDGVTTFSNRNSAGLAWLVTQYVNASADPLYFFHRLNRVGAIQCILVNIIICSIDHSKPLSFARQISQNMYTRFVWKTTDLSRKCVKWCIQTNVYRSCSNRTVYAYVWIDQYAYDIEWMALSVVRPRGPINVLFAMKAKYSLIFLHENKGIEC